MKDININQLSYALTNNTKVFIIVLFVIALSILMLYYKNSNNILQGTYKKIIKVFESSSKINNPIVNLNIPDIVWDGTTLEKENVFRYLKNIENSIE